MNTRVNCNKCWKVFQSWLPRHFPEVTWGFIPLTPSINDFSDKKRIIPHVESFTLELPAPYSLEFLKTGYEWVLDVNISSRTPHPDLVSKNISIYPDNI